MGGGGGLNLTSIKMMSNCDKSSHCSSKIEIMEILRKCCISMFKEEDGHTWRMESKHLTFR